MLKKLLFKLNVLIDTLKGIVIYLVVWALIIIFGSVIVHNIWKMGDISNSYKGEYKKLVEVKPDKMMNVVVYGEGEKTIVILPGFGMQSPVLQYKAIADKLKDEYRVVVVEYYGYGFSMSADSERNLDNIVDEIKGALELKEIYEYILMPHSHSNMYAMKMVQKYPEVVQGVITLDPLYPSQYEDTYFYDSYLDEYHNVQLTSIAELTGFARVLSYAMPDFFYINTLEREGIWTKDEILILRNRIATSYLTETMVKEMKMLRTNGLELKDYVYPDYLPVLQLLVSDTVDEYKALKNNNLIKKDLEEFANEQITNSEIQMTEILKGNHDVQFTNYDAISQYVKAFINEGTTENVVIEEKVDKIDDGNVENTVNVDNENENENENIVNVDNKENSKENAENVIVIDLNDSKKTENKVKKPTTNKIYDPYASKKVTNNIQPVNATKSISETEDFTITIE